MSHISLKNNREQTRFYLPLIAIIVMSIPLLACALTGGSDKETFSSSDAQRTAIAINQDGLPRFEQGSEGAVSSGGTVALTIVPAPTNDNEPRTIRWTPPSGKERYNATNFQFPGIQPEPGGPPFIFKNIHKDDRIQVSYTAPTVTYGPYSMSVILNDSISTIYSDGRERGSFRETVIDNNPRTVKTIPITHIQRLSPVTPKHTSATVDVWKLSYFSNLKMVTMTTSLCDDWRSKLLSDEYFFAARIPITKSTTITDVYPLPFVLDSPYSQTLQLWAQPNGTLFTATMEYRADRHTFLANELPSAAGEHWMALGANTIEPATCPSNLNAAPGDWGFMTNMTIDLHDQPNACEGCMVQFYYCYEGEESPLRSIENLALNRISGMTTYQDEGITCIGPTPLSLGGELTMGGEPGSVITPTQPITFHEHIINNTGNPLTVTLKYTSTVNGWHFYGGTNFKPNLSTPLNLPTQISLGDGSLGDEVAHLWIINTAIPSDTLAGSHSMIITATSTTTPTLFTWDSIPLWSSNEWVPPAGSKTYVYLPLVIK